MNSYTISGGCICGGIRYTVDKPAKCIIHCHCSRCRKGHGGLMTTCAFVKSRDLTIVKGSDKLTTFVYPPEVQRKFCSICGCSIIYAVKEFSDHVFYYPATLDDGNHPGHSSGSEHHIYVNSKAEWEVFESSLPWHEEDMEDENYEKDWDDWVNT